MRRHRRGNITFFERPRALNGRVEAVEIPCSRKGCSIQLYRLAGFDASAIVSLRSQISKELKQSCSLDVQGNTRSHLAMRSLSQCPAGISVPEPRLQLLREACS